ncbi:hypothetical protein [Sulfurisphaera ohwakuensis]|uniref:Uncharacterized protein n=1 Tax=Sulfurisphaera ohwakuensis TaxID=69656 RepID=A0A650CIR2_SULOH|nr:hypothetical protein [Sulfurisphaera ohwakuensis]MBB5253563.1 hypothetical protein [Sulfurisphaera ohwakuensis]QGR17417.1 hypothetical protein D1869_09565 [Sulfurisphaera ohwakuensis]
MKAYDILAYLLEHLEPNSVTALVTNDGIPLMLSKDSEYEISVYICKDENVKKFHKEFDKPTLHRAVIELLEEISSYLGKEIAELNISSSVKFEDCVPKRQEVKRERPQKKRVIDTRNLIEEMRKLPSAYNIIPLFTDNGKLIAIVLENLSLISTDKIVKSISRVSDGNISPINVDPITIIYVLSTLKFDLQKGNPFSSYEKYTFFTALYQDLGEIGEEGEFQNKKMIKKQGKFFSVTSKGILKPIPLEFLDVSREKKNTLNVGYFIHDGEKFVKLNSFDLFEYHEKNIFTINSYLFSSFIVTQKDFKVEYQNFDKLISNFVNSVISKGIGAKYVKDVFELERILYDIQYVRAVAGNEISIVDPISLWYYRNKGEDVRLCDSCELKDKVELWNRIIKGFYREFLI